MNNIARVIEEGIGNLIINKVYNNSEHIAEKIMDLLELDTIDIMEKEFNYPKPHIKEFKIYFYVNSQIYRLYVTCYQLIDKSLVVYNCLVFKGE